MEAICQVVTSSGDICGRSIKKDKSSSTKSFHAHLDTFHRISDPSLAKKTKMKHMDISKWSKSGTLQPQEILSGSCPTPQQRRHDLGKTTNQKSIATHVTPPNFTAFMAVTAHFIDENFQMKNLTLGVPQVEAINLLHTITADNASVNFKMAQELNLQVPHFKSSTHILGCVAHVINLAAKIGIRALGSVDEEDDGCKISMANGDTDLQSIGSNNPMNIGLLISPPDGAGINTQTILKHIHGLCTWHTLVLEKTCTHFCKRNAKASKFLLSSDKWDPARNLTKLLEPLHDATIILCGLAYPTLNKALPVYIVLLEHLDSIRQGLYNQSQLIQPALQMIQKFDQYIREALTKPTYMCAMILDPKFKTVFWKNHEDFIFDCYWVLVKDIEDIFLKEALSFEEMLPTKDKTHASETSISSSSNTKGIFSSALYQPAPKIQGIQSEIQHYLNEDIETKEFETLPFWAAQQKSLPKLSLMAR
ncbi:hypothetical protein PGT21_002977 [Puccinia graminis f. sp. tritici]|uniref:hAT-like transposase RNase-H fold domain-containing protein n=1 Tax=Puccinia graminis f. sp. tritici TaxID=56615 RepID=A0A5B0QVL1_PUCGR|nr:hypothetical protein PGT21_002977 [Puccinia graminis f. sp. tritici]